MSVQVARRALLANRVRLLLLSVLFLFCLWWFFLPRLGDTMSSSSSSLRRGYLSARARAGAKNDNLRDIDNATLGFEDIFVISSAARPLRRDGIVLGAALSQVKISLFDAVNASHLDDMHALIPPVDVNQRLTGGGLGCYRSHMDVMREIVLRNVTSALVFEDDVDWDVRIRSQLGAFALSTRALIQPLAGSRGQGSSRYADATFPEPRHHDDDADADDLHTETEKETETPPMHLDSLPATMKPSVSPYGDGWDMLWLGHCGQDIPAHSSSPDGQRVPKGVVMQTSDKTVPPRDKLWAHLDPFLLKEKYPTQTRLVHHSLTGTCTQAYAISQAGARKMLSDLALNPAQIPIDLALRAWCEGRLDHNKNKNMCLTVNPSLFGQYKPIGPEGAASIINQDPNNTRYRLKGATDLIRMSVRMNKDAILGGREADILDRYDEEEAGRPMDQFA